MEKPSSVGSREHIGNSRLFAKLADSYRARGDIDRAIDILTRGLEKSPHYLTARIILAACFTQKGEFGTALEEYQRILREDPFHIAAVKRMGKLLITMGQSAQAREFIERYLDEVPGDVEMRRLYTSLDDEIRNVLDTRDEGEYRGESGEEKPEEGQKEQPMTRKEEVGREEAGEAKERIRARENSAAPREEELIATMTLAELYASQGFLEKAIEIYQKVLSREPSNELAKKRIEAMLKGEPHAPAEEEARRSKEEAAAPAPEGVDWKGGGPPGELIVDEEFEKFKKWLNDLTKKKGT